MRTKVRVANQDWTGQRHAQEEPKLGSLLHSCPATLVSCEPENKGGGAGGFWLCSEWCTCTGTRTANS